MWIEVKGKMFNFDNVSRFEIEKNKLFIYYNFSATSCYGDMECFVSRIDFDTQEQAQAEYDRIKNLLLKE